MPTIAMMTDFGIKDGNVGVMKGVIWSICPDARIADLSHMIQPQNVAEAALVLARSAPYFASLTVFLVVVDPGVGTERRPMAARIGDRFFVGPDNGLITLWLERTRARQMAEQFMLLDRPELWLSQISHVFHGRDIFAPVAAHLAAGEDLGRVGSPIADPVLLDLPRARTTKSGLEGEIIHIDHFGNLASNIYEDHLASATAAGGCVVTLGGRRISGLVKTFGDRSPGELVALIGSTGNLIVAEVNGNAAAALGSELGDPIRVELPGRAGGSKDDA